MVSQPLSLQALPQPVLHESEFGRSPFRRPGDWPKAGSIDLTRHDLPHASSTLEWWYFNCHLRLPGRLEACLYVAFFRQLASDPSQDGPLEYTHSIAWGLRLPGRRLSHNYVAVDELAPKVGLANLDAGVKADDPRIERALREILARGRVPGPTRMMTSAPRVETERFFLDFGGNRWQKLSDRGYRLELVDASSGYGCDLTFQLDKPPARYGRDGVVHGVSGERMFYYYVPRVKVQGRVRVAGECLEVEQGAGWYDHEFGLVPAGEPAAANVEAKVEKETCWRWLSIQLEDGTELSVFFITRRGTGEPLDRWTMRTDASGVTQSFDDTSISTLEVWRSTRTFIEYPTALRVRVPSAGIDVVARATFEDQEVVSVISDPSFWEGTVSVVGTVGSDPVRGRGWLECKGFGHASLDDFYSSVGREVRARLAAAFPSTMGDAALRRVMVRGAPGAPPSAPERVQADLLADSVVAPIRSIVDRGGKGWRSYAALACIDLVGGDSRKFLHWLIMPEIVHVGSLIVDDVEDESTVRRGGPACHELYGTARAINAGTAAYFLAEPPLDDDALPAETKLRIYRLYFDAMRAGHAGQGLDLSDASHLAVAAAETGATEEIERHVLSVYRLKTAVPAAMFARAGALLGGGTDAQVEAVGRFFEAVGLAFQIIDDVLNVSGFERDLKERGEDVKCGKITLPVVKAFELLEPEQRSWLYDTLTRSERDPFTVRAVCDLLEECGALVECRRHAHHVVERAWRDLDRVVEDSQYKLMFRAFSWYVLERHY